MADPSLWTKRKDICDGIAVHPIPEHISKDDFVAKHGAFLEDAARTEIGKKHFLKITQYVQTHTLTDKLLEIGMAPPRDMVVTHIVFRDVQDSKEVMRDPSIKALVEEAKLWGYDNGASLFTVDTVTHHGNTNNLAGNYDESYIAVYKIPTGVPKQLFEDKVQVLLESLLKIQTLADRLAELTIWHQSSAVDFEVLQSLAMPAPAALMVCMGEVTGAEAILSSAEVQELLKEHMVRRDLPLGLEGDFFLATKVVRFEKD
ncbi:hypothetical protein C8F01DRAFT_216519 [Mycena amicta]|nr:hypothetical protein C8F01DRAFT_216519 [Mycena amicta]